MSRTQNLDKELLRSLFSAAGAYQLAYSLVFGAQIWHTFVSSIIQFKTLPRHQFGRLQAKLFPTYFTMSSILTMALLSAWLFNHPDVVANILSFRNADVAQAWALIVAGGVQTINWVSIGPMTPRVMYKRHALEKSEKKSYYEADISDDMKSLNRSFSYLHGISSLSNLICILAVTFHGLWIGKFGIHGY